MKQYKVEITKEALQDMEDIYNYIAIDLLAPDNELAGTLRRAAVNIHCEIASGIMTNTLNSKNANLQIFPCRLAPKFLIYNLCQ